MEYHIDVRCDCGGLILDVAVGEKVHCRKCGKAFIVDPPKKKEKKDKKRGEG
jgi:hypothetical protein